jgi:hypothetical protein
MEKLDVNGWAVINAMISRLVMNVGIGKFMKSRRESK